MSLTTQVSRLKDDSPDGKQVVELGPGPGALTRKLFEQYPHMTAVEIDQRAVAFLGQKLPGLQVVPVVCASLTPQYRAHGPTPHGSTPALTPPVHAPPPPLPDTCRCCIWMCCAATGLIWRVSAEDHCP